MFAHSRVRRKVNLLREAHQEHIWPLGEPFIVQLLLRRGPLHVVRRLETPQQVGEGGVDILRERRHAVGLCSVCVLA